ncbi:MAG: glycosyltransferase family 4 protein [Clostridia bacterium]|nr:glycosyltransferase family 4 protein [Clostridia bacterium]
MKKTYFVGDMLNNTGPAIVNKNYYPYLKGKMYFCFTNNKILRTIHFMIYIIFVKNVIISGYSKLNIVLLKIAKKLNKKTLYLMHGFVKEEVKYKNIDNKEERIKSEYELLKNVGTIICVSEKFSKYLKKEYSEFKDKIIYINNGIDIKINKSRIKHEKFTIISVGGGMKQKNNLKICEAINRAKRDVKYVVIGKMLEDGEKIKNYTFVEYYENLSHDEVLNKMCESDLYIQNSYFETFGLSIVEALECGCDILISKNIGALSILENIDKNDIIADNNDNEELLTKINYKMLHKNKNINYDKDKCCVKNKALELLQIVNE